MSASDPTAHHEAWLLQIQQQLAVYAKLRRQVRYFPLFAALTAPLGLVASPIVALVIFLAWMSIWATTLYITWMRTWQYSLELADMRADLRRARRAE